jgi:hypothetical protein
MKLWSIALLSALTTTSAFAQSGITLGNPAYGGTGCPAGTASVTLSPDARALSILFDQYVAEAGSFTGRRIDRKSCNIAIPVNLPQGYSVSVLEVDYRGFNSIPTGGRTQFNVEYFFAGQSGPRYSKVFTDRNNGDYTLTNTLIASAIVWSPCGAQVNLRTNSSIMATANTRNEQTMITVDSQDVTAGILYTLQWRSCR